MSRFPSTLAHCTSWKWLAWHVAVFLLVSRFDVRLLALHIAGGVAFELADEFFPLGSKTSPQPDVLETHDDWRSPRS